MSNKPSLTETKREVERVSIGISEVYRPRCFVDPSNSVRNCFDAITTQHRRIKRCASYNDVCVQNERLILAGLVLVLYILLLIMSAHIWGTCTMRFSFGLDLAMTCS